MDGRVKPGHDALGSAPRIFRKQPHAKGGQDTLMHWGMRLRAAPGMTES
jgi:hypothetical protein